MEPLNKISASLYPNRFTGTPAIVNVLTFLQTDKYKTIVEDYRAGKISGDKFPCMTIPAICEGMHGTDSAKQLTGLICIDIDGKHNERVTNWTEFVLSLRWMPEIFFAGLSRSGNGAFIVMPLENVTKENFIEYFLNLEKWFKENYKIRIDPACKNISRLRYASYNILDETSFVNLNASVWKWKTKQPAPNPALPATMININDEKKFDALVKWTNKKVQFVNGSRHAFTIKIAGACCRFGIQMESAVEMINENYWSKEPDYIEHANELERDVKAAYKKYILGSAFNNQ